MAFVILHGIQDTVRASSGIDRIFTDIIRAYSPEREGDVSDCIRDTRREYYRYCSSCLLHVNRYHFQICTLYYHGLSRFCSSNFACVFSAICVRGIHYHSQDVLVLGSFSGVKTHVQVASEEAECGFG
jgi:hypothetical protein